MAERLPDPGPAPAPRPSAGAALLRGAVREVASMAAIVLIGLVLIGLGIFALWGFHRMDVGHSREVVHRRMQQVCRWIEAYRQEAGAHPAELWMVQGRLGIPDRDWFAAISNPRYLERSRVNASFLYSPPATAGAIMLVDRCELIDGDSTWVATGDGQVEWRRLGRSATAAP